MPIKKNFFGEKRIFIWLGIHSNKMNQNQYTFFEKEYEKYEQIMQEYKKDNSKVFEDENFPATNKSLENIKGIDVSMIKWKRIDEVYKAPLFKKSKIHQLYVNQGSLGDCYFISALSRIAKQSNLVQALFEKPLPDRILGEITDSINIKCGAVVVYFRAFGRRTPVLIDTLIPFDINKNRPIFVHPINRYKSAWICLVEKAFAKLNGNYANIDGGFFSDSIYSLFGYYRKFFPLTCGPKNALLQILDYQKFGCLMDAAIITRDDDYATKALIAKKGLHDGHSYLLAKVRSYKNKIFLQLRNPWGSGVWKGDYSTDSELWTPELKKALHDDQKDGRFWMLDKDFFKYYNLIEVSKPTDAHWINQKFVFKPTSIDMDSLKSNLDKKNNFVFKLTQNIPEGKKARLRILAEKRNTNYDQIRANKSFVKIFASKNNGKKLIFHEITDRKLKDSGDNISYLSIPINGINDVVTFAIVHEAPDTIDSYIYVNVFCEFEFELSEIDHPETQFSRGETSGPVIDNFSIAEPNAALILKRTIIRGNKVMCLKNPTINDFSKQTRLINEEIITKNLINETKELHYSFCGNQINKKKFIFNNELFVSGKNSNVYIVTEVETGEECAAIISNSLIDFVIKSFSQKVAIMRMLKYPSIINFIGFSESDFLYKPNPMIITDLYSNGTLQSNLSKLNNTKKMINILGIAFGMNYIHQHKIILRDLWCSNILVDRNMYPIISNFNSAQFVNNDLEYFGLNIPNHLIAPELIESTTPYSFSADVFAFGMIFYHIVSNVEPTIKHGNKINFINKMIDGVLPNLDIVSPKYQDFIRQMWCQNPEERLTLEQIINKLLNEHDTFWLDDIDKDEIERYIRQFGASIKTKNKTDYIDIIKGINEDSLPLITNDQILSDSSIPKSTKDDIKRANDLLKNRQQLSQNMDLFYNVGNFLNTKLPSNIFNSIKYLKASTLSGHKVAIIDIAKILCTNAPDEASLQIGVDVANIAADLDLTEAFVILGNLYKEGKGVKKNILMSAINFKVAADRGDSKAMFEYATILMNFQTSLINKNDKKVIIFEAKKIVYDLEGKNSYFYEEARLTFDTVENNDASLFVAKKYLEKALKKGCTESKEELKKINDNYEDIINPPPYFEELCKDVSE